MEQKNVRLRTIDEAHAEIIKMDPDSKASKKRNNSVLESREKEKAN